MTVIWVMFFIPTSPCYMGTMAMIIFLVWMAIGIILYLGNSGQRRKVPKEERVAPCSPPWATNNPCQV